MDNTLFLRIRIPDVPNAVVALNEVNLEGNLAGLDSEQIKGKCDSPGHELVYVHRGRALEKKLSLKDQGVRNNSTIYVMRKKLETESPAPPLTLLTDEKLKQITSAFKRFTASRLWELSHPRVLSRILKMYPAIRDDLGALAILRDPILLSSMKSPENFQEIAKQYPIFIQAASSIADILHKLDSTKVRAPEFEDSDSSSSSSSSDFEASMNNNNNNNNNNVPGSSRPITQQQLADALAYVAGAAFRGSLTQGGAEESGAREPMDQDESANEESRPQPSVVPSVPVGVAQPAAAAPSEDVRGRYSQELIQMREMGLIDEEVNLQALLICNGDLEAAINLVFSSTN